MIFCLYAKSIVRSTNETAAISSIGSYSANEKRVFHSRTKNTRSTNHLRGSGSTNTSHNNIGVYQYGQGWRSRRGSYWGPKLSRKCSNGSSTQQEQEEKDWSTNIAKKFKDKIQALRSSPLYQKRLSWHPRRPQYPNFQWQGIWQYVRDFSKQVPKTHGRLCKVRSSLLFVDRRLFRPWDCILWSKVVLELMATTLRDRYHQ